MKEPLVTIAIPVYNCERFIKQSITSVLNQTYKNFELIVTDDGSTDNTLGVLQSIHDPRLKVISDGENRGISYRLNQQIDLAHGFYFVRMDGDDLMFPNRVEEQLKFMQNHPEIDVCGSKAVVIGDKNEILGMRGTAKSPQNIKDVFLYGRFIHPTVMGKIEWFRKWRYRENMSGCEDLDLWIRSYDESNFSNMEEPLLFYRDPMTFKLKTFIKRQKQITLCHWDNRERIPNTWTFLQCYSKIFIAATAALLLCAIHCDSLWIKRRNQPIDTKLHFDYTNILAQVLK